MREKQEEGIKYKPSRLAYFWNYVASGVIIFLLFLVVPHLNIFANIFHFLLFFFSLAFLSWLFDEPELRRFFRSYYITDKQVVKVEGILTKNRVTIPYQNISGVNLRKSVLGRLLNFGDIMIYSTGFKQEAIKMIGIRNPEKVVQLLETKAKLRKQTSD